MNSKQTYDNYFKEYYHSHKDTILANSAEYRKEASKKYYQKNKVKLKAKARLKRLEAKIAKLEAEPQNAVSRLYTPSTAKSVSKAKTKISPTH